MSDPVITELELFEVNMPFAEGARAAMDASEGGLGMAIPAEEPWEVGEFLYCRAVAEDGSEGWGEAYVWMPESGAGPADLARAIEGVLARYVLGASPFDTGAIAARMDRNVTRNEMAKGLLDLTLHDVAARIAGRPVHDLIGGSMLAGAPYGGDPARIPLCGLVPLGSIDDTVAICEWYVGTGTRTLRLKLGTGIEADRATVAAVRAAVGHDVRIRVDYNQAYRPEDAIRAIRTIEPFGIDAAEQPVAVGDLLGLARVQRHVAVPLFTHEGFFDMTDLVAQEALGAVRAVGINAERPGGMTAALRAVDYARARGMGVIIHNQPLGIGSAALVHLAAARADHLGHAIECAGPLMWKEDLLVNGLHYSDGYVEVPTGPGWGVEVDRDRLDTHLAAAPVLLRR